MADVIREFLIKMGFDAREVEQGLPKVQKELDKTKEKTVTLAGAAKAGAAAVAAFTAAIYAVGAAAGRGDTINSVARAFDKLQESAGNTAGLDKLRAATTGLMTDFELMKQSNIASQMGITPEIFEEIAASADTLADAVGKDLPEALATLTTGFGKAQDKALIELGINVDLAKAETALAEKYGKTREELSELGKKEAFRVAALEAMRERVKAVTTENNSAGEAYQRVTVALQNQFDKVAQGVDKNTELAEVLNRTSTIIKNMPIEGFTALIASAGKALETAAGYAADFARGLDVIFQSSSTAKIATMDKEIAKLNETLGDQETHLKKIESLGPSLLGGRASSLAHIRAEIVATKEQIAVVEKHRAEEYERGRAVKKAGEAIQQETAVVKPNTTETNTNTGALFSNTNAKKEAAAAAEELAKKQAELTKSFLDLSNSAKNESLAAGFEKQVTDAIAKLDSGAFNSALGNLEDQVRKGQVEEYMAQYGAAIGNGITRSQIEALADLKTSDLIKKYPELLEKEQKQAFQNSVDFFADILTSVSDDAAFNLEDVLTDALKRVAIGFGAQMLAQLAGNMGIDVSGMTSAQGFGGWLAKQVLGSGDAAGGGNILSSLFGGGSSAAGGSFLESLFGGAGAATEAAPFGTILSAGGESIGTLAGPMGSMIGETMMPMIGSALAAAGPYAAAAAAAYMGHQMWQQNDFLDGLPDVLNPFIALEWADNTFGGTKDKDTLARRGFRGQLQERMGEDLNFRGIRGDVSLFDSDYSLQNRTAFTDQAVGMVNPLAQILTGGDDKLSSDAAGIFADAVDDVSSYNEMLIQTQSLMDALGINAEEAKNELTGLFLDGKISLDEFTSGVASLNVLATENLVGTGSVGDAIGILTDKLATPRHQLKAIELAFKEMGELGIDTTSEVSAYLLDKFGPAIADVFGQLSTVGIDSWEEIKNATADQIAQIFGILAPLRSEVGDTFTAATDDVSQAFSDMASSIGNDLDKIARNSRDISARVANNLKFKATVENEIDNNLTPAEHTR